MMDNYKNINYKVTYSGLNRKRQVIDKTLEELHNMQMQMIEEAVVYSNCREANEVINYIKGKL
jgi:hypothetical protein